MVSVSVLKSSNTLCLCVYDVTVCRFTSRKCYLLRVELFSSKRVFFIYRLFRQFCSLYNFLSPENFIRFSVKLVTEPTTNTFFFFVNLCVYFSFFILIDTTDNKFKMYHLTLTIICTCKLFYAVVIVTFYFLKRIIVCCEVLVFTDFRLFLSIIKIVSNPIFYNCQFKNIFIENVVSKQRLKHCFISNYFYV